MEKDQENRLFEQLDKILDSQKDMHGQIQVLFNKTDNIEKNVMMNTEDLKVHIKGTLLNTERLNLEIEERKALSQDVKVLKARKEKIDGFAILSLKIAGLLGVGCTILGFILKLLGIL